MCCFCRGQKVKPLDGKRSIVTVPERSERDSERNQFTRPPTRAGRRSAPAILRIAMGGRVEQDKLCREAKGESAE